MIKIRALNDDSLSDEDAPTIRREAQEEIALDMYNKSLRHQCSGNYEEAISILEKLLTENIPQLESQGGLPKTMSTLKYSCYFNVGNIYIQKKNDSSALDNLLKAADLDSSDVTLWHKIGTIALRLDRFRQAAYAFLKGLECNESHWPCLDKLISVLYAIQDTVTCLLYIGKALILDKDYVKGHVLRKLIFESNPATKEYYQAYNPDYNLEPDFDSVVSEEEEKMVVKDLEPLCKRLNTVEKSLDPKPLPCIALPTPLQEFTWVSLGKTILNLHNYITENKLSYFSKVDLTKCMSREYADIESVSLENTTEIANETITDTKPIVLPPTEPQQAMEVENEIKTEDNFEQRRPSLSSENNNLSEPNCSQGEDNDEMDQDTEDQEDNTEQKEDKKRSAKRKRDLLSDLKIWGWHSKRKSAKKGRSEKDLTIQDALTRIIPPYLLPNGINIERNRNFEKSKSIDNVFSYFKSQLSSTSVNFEKYFGTENERNDVTKFWTKERDYLDVVDLIEEYTVSLAKMWNKKWPKELIFLYLEAYDKYREHFEHPELFNGLSSFEEIKNDALVTVMYGEIVYFYLKTEDKDKNKRTVHPTSLIQLQLLSTWKRQWQEDYFIMFVRIHWLRANVLKGLSNHTLAICAYQLIEEIINEEESNKADTQFMLILPNCTNYNVITKEITQKLLNHLEIIESLSYVQSLYEKKLYNEVIDILMPTFGYGSNAPTWGKMGRPAQLGFLLHSFWFVDRIKCFVCTEKCLAEATEHFISPTVDDDKWDMLLCKCIDILHEIIKEETVIVVDNLSQQNRVRLIENLCRIVTKQLHSEGRSTIPLGTVTPWLVLHYILLREEHRQQAQRITKHIKKDKRLSGGNKSAASEPINEIPPSIAILFSAHEFLGNKSWCLINEGELLHFLIDKILDRLDTPIFEPLRDKIDIHLEQAFFCLYQHPSKKNKVSRHLADHNVNPLKLSWERAQQLYEFFCPESLPEFESFKSISISSDLEQLLQRITALVPSQYDPNPLVPKIREFIKGNVENLPELIDFPIKTRAIYYLLGDYYFKQSEVGRSLKYFLLDLCCNPLRLDSWASMALGLGNRLEEKLNRCESFKNEQEFKDEAKSAQACFKQALKLANNHITLWIEFGTFEYAVHSYYSRILKYESDTISMEKFEKLENQKEEYLDSSGKSFKKALDLHQQEEVEQDERWLHHYMLGKVAEKRRMEPAEYLQHYLTALELLQENKASYPEKVNYNNPQHLAVEVLEIHYRVHASVLKYLELHEGKNIPIAVGKMFKKCLDRCTFPEGNRNAAIQQIDNKEPLQEKTSTTTVEGEGVDNKEVKTETVPEVTQLKQEEKEVDIKKTLNEAKELPGKETITSDNDPKDVIMISDSDDERGSTKTKQNNSEDEILLSPPQQLRIKNVQELMDEVMLKTMKEEESIEDIDSDTANAEVEFNKFFENTKDKLQTEINKCIKEEQEKNEAVIATAKNVVDDKKVTEIKIKKEDEDKGIRKSLDDTTTTCSSSSDSSSSDSDSDDSSSTSSTATSSDAPTGFLGNSEIDDLINQCIEGLEQYIIRLPQNYKALYRLTHLFFHYKARKDLSKCRQLLLGQYRCRNNMMVTGLFSDRKTNNFFNGVWRIPSGEIDRPGSLAAHMVRCVTILLQVLRNTNDHKILLDVCLQLRRIPDQDKVYVKEADRIQLADQALFLCMQSLKVQVKNINNMSHSSAQKFLLDLYRAYQRVQKHIMEKEREFSGMLEEVYKKYMKEKLPENVNTLDLAVKFCQQHKAAEKIKIQQQKPPPVLIAPTVSTSAPVHPSPSTITSTMNIPIKRPTIPGRARGRPPGPSKNPGIRKPSSRGRGVNRSLYNPFTSYQSPMFDPKSLNFALQYQELLRQYSQLTQFSQLATSPSSVMSSNLMQMMTQLASGRMNPLSPSLGSNLWGSMGTMGVTHSPTPTTMSSMNNPLQQQSANKLNTSSSSLQKISSQKSAGSGSFILQGQGVGGIKKMPFMSPNIPSTSTFKYPSTDVPKVKANKDVTKTTSSTYISKDISHSSKISSSSSKSDGGNVLMSEVSKLTSQLVKERPSISITPVVPTGGTSVVSKIPTSPMKTLQEKLADKQKHASAKNVSKSFSFENVSPSSKPTIMPSSQQIPTFPKESGITVSQISKVPVAKQHQEHKKSKPETSTKVKEFGSISMNISSTAQPIRSIPKPADTQRKDSSDDDVIVIE